MLSNSLISHSTHFMAFTNAFLLPSTSFWDVTWSMMMIMRWPTLHFSSLTLSSTAGDASSQSSMTFGATPIVSCTNGTGITLDATCSSVRTCFSLAAMCSVVVGTNARLFPDDVRFHHRASCLSATPSGEFSEPPGSGWSAQSTILFFQSRRVSQG